ncbi:MAG TPA: PAS domain S-box protein [Spirochaetota bacterium]|nr:PAS domain S-box protein [Spirochaetota bacterium]
MNNYAGKTILLVEDEPVILLIQSSILKKNGFNVISAISGKKAIELVRGEENIDLVLMDIDLGKGMDGTETAGVILKERDIPVLFLSSHTEPEIVEKTEGITSYGYVVKNSGDTVLLASIKMAFRLHDERMIVKRQSEKLQSLNEELEATNEELNAAFEELEAANEELIESQNEILISEEKFRNIFTNAPVGLLHYNSNGIITECNEVFVGIVGSSAGRLIGLDMRTLEDQNLVEALAAALSGETGFYEGNYHSVTGDKVTPVKVWFTPLFSSDGKVSGGICITEDISVQKKALEDVSAREVKFRTLFENLSQGVIYYDSNGEIIAANPAAEKILGSTHEELLGRTSQYPGWQTIKEDGSIFPEEEYPVNISLNYGKPVKDVVIGLFNSSEGKYRWIVVDSFPEYRTGEEKPFRVSVVFIDITERRIFESAIQEQRQILDTVINAIPSPVFFKDKEGRYSGCNRAFLDYIGYRKEDVIGRTVYDVAPADLSEKYHAADLQIMDAGGDQVYEGGVRYADGTIRDVIFHKAVLYAPDNTINGIVGVMIDITERKKIENRLIESESRYRSLFENNQSVMLIIDPSEGSIVDANEAAVKYYGWSRDELKSMNINQINTLSPDEIKREMDKAKLSDKNIFNFRHHHSDGSISYVESYSGLIIIREKEYLYSIIHDISDRIKAETELRKAVEEKGALLQELQHRVKNNLAMISGLIGLESIRSGDTKVIVVLKNLRNRISALEKLYSSLYHTGNVREIRLDTYISEIADSIIKTYVSELQNIKIVTDLDPIVVSIKHAASIGLITNELLVNALKYAFPDSKEGLITVTLKVSGKGYELTVTDNGIGLPPGFDLKSSTGSGIMIVDMLVEHMEGAFDFEAGEFTGFKVTVPFMG